MNKEFLRQRTTEEYPLTVTVCSVWTDRLFDCTCITHYCKCFFSVSNCSGIRQNKGLVPIIFCNIIGQVFHFIMSR